MSVWFFFALLGVFVGLASGLFGIGGGVIIVPTLLATLDKFGFESESTIYVATKTSLAIILFTGLYAAITHHKKVPLDKKILLEIGAFVALGSFLGAFAMRYIPPAYLKLLFASYITYISIKMWLGFKQYKGDPNHKKETIYNIIAGLMIGCLSALLGIGGGTIAVPYLTWRNVPIGQAVGLSSAFGFVISLISTGTNLFTGLFDTATYPPYTYGQIFLPAVGGVLISSLIFTRVGVHFAHKLPQEVLRKVFAFLLFLIAIKSITSLIG